jgi:O-antigen/teichoic acid export membrane protein
LSTVATRIEQFGLSLLRPGQFGRHVATLAGGTAVSQAIILASAPLLTRLYSPEAFGIVGAFLSLHAILLTTMCGGYEFATPIAEDDVTAANLLTLSGLVALAMSVALGLAIWQGGDWVASWNREFSVKPYLWLIPPVLLVGGWLNGIHYWSLREKAYATVSKARIAQSISRALAQGGLGVAWASPFALILGEALGMVVNAVVLGRRAWRETAHVFRSVSWPGMQEASRRYVKFPLLTMPGQLVGGLATGLPCILLPILYSPLEAGLFFVARRFAFAPTTLVSCAVANVFFVELAAGKRDSRQTLRQFLRLTVVLTMLALAGALVLCTAPSWATLLFGAQWDLAGWMLLALAPMLVGWFVVTPLHRVYYVFEKQQVLSGLELVRLALTACVIVAGAAAGQSVVAVVWWLSWGMFFLYCLHWALMLSILQAAAKSSVP